MSTWMTLRMGAGSPSPVDGFSLSLMAKRMLAEREQKGNSLSRTIWTRQSDLHGFADEAGIGDAARGGAFLHRIEQTLGQAHVELRGLFVELEPHRREAREVVRGQVGLIDEALGLDVSLEGRDSLFHRLRFPCGAYSARR